MTRRWRHKRPSWGQREGERRLRYRPKSVLQGTEHRDPSGDTNACDDMYRAGLYRFLGCVGQKGTVITEQDTGGHDHGVDERSMRECERRAVLGRPVRTGARAIL